MLDILKVVKAKAIIQICLIINVTEEKIKVTSTANALNSYKEMKYGAIQTNMWNCGSIKGEVSIELFKNEMLTEINLVDASIKQRTIFGYPEIALGLNLMGQHFNENAVKTLEFPMKLSDLMSKDVKMTSEFQIEKVAREDIPFNISYDFWIKNDPLINEVPDKEDCEIMIWLYHSKQHPIGIVVDRIDLECNLNGKKAQIPVDIWKGRGARWLTISLLFDRKLVPNNAEISFELRDVFRIAQSFMENQELGQFLMGVELGTEFGDPDSRETSLAWKLKKYLIETEGKEYNILGEN